MSGPRRVSNNKQMPITARAASAAPLRDFLLLFLPRRRRRVDEIVCAAVPRAPLPQELLLSQEELSQHERWCAAIISFVGGNDGLHSCSRCSRWRHPQRGSDPRLLLRRERQPRPLPHSHCTATTLCPRRPARPRLSASAISAASGAGGRGAEQHVARGGAQREGVCPGAALVPGSDDTCLGPPCSCSACC